MSAQTDLAALWAELTQTTKGYKQMTQPLVAGTHWANAKLIYDKITAELAPSAPVAPPFWVGDYRTNDFSQFDVHDANLGATVNDPTFGVTPGAVLLPKTAPGYTSSAKLARIVCSNGFPSSSVSGAATVLWANQDPAPYASAGAKTWFKHLFVLPDGTDPSWPGTFKPVSGDGLGSSWHVLTEWHIGALAATVGGGNGGSASSTMVEIGWGGDAQSQIGGPALLLRPSGHWPTSPYADAHGNITFHIYETDKVQTFSNRAAGGTIAGAIQPLKFNHWYESLVYQEFDPDPAKGYLEWWVDGNLRFADHISTLYTTQEGLGFEGGIYRSYNGTAQPNDAMYQQAMIAGPTRASLIP